MIIPILWFIVGLVLLIKGGDWFVDGATGIAHRFHIPELLIGATVVSIGTTLPEVMVSATSALSGHGEMAYGNSLGSIICNTALIAALTVTIRPSGVDRKALRLPVIFFFGAAAFYATVAYVFGEFERWVGAVLLAIFLSYVILSILQARKQLSAELLTAEALPDEDSNGDPTPEEGKDEKKSSRWSVVKEIVFLVVGAALIAVGADLLVDNGTLIAGMLGVPESVIALTFIALGTSLPELVTAITSIAKGHGALSLGNVIGANLFNLVLVSGVSSLLSPFDVPNNTQIAGINTSLLVDIPVVILVMAILTLPAILRQKLSRAQGVVLLCVYAAFCVFQFVI